MDELRAEKEQSEGQMEDDAKRGGHLVSPGKDTWMRSPRRHRSVININRGSDVEPGPGGLKSRVAGCWLFTFIHVCH